MRRRQLSVLLHPKSSSASQSFGAVIGDVTQMRACTLTPALQRTPSGLNAGEVQQEELVAEVEGGRNGSAERHRGPRTRQRTAQTDLSVGSREMEGT